METDFPPLSVSRARLNTIRALSLTLVITGDPNGLNWTCTIISDLVDEGTMLGYSNEIARVMQMFIH